MTRPKDENGYLLPQAHKRIPEADGAVQAGFFKLGSDNRLCHLTTKRKLAIARKAVDHVVDGDAAPKALFKKDTSRPDNHALAEGWDAAVSAVRSWLKEAGAAAANAVGTERSGVNQA